MRTRYKKRLAQITKAIHLLNKVIEDDPDRRGRFFVKNIAFSIPDAERANKTNNNFCLILRFYDKETGYYIERLAYIDTENKYYAGVFGFYTYKALLEFAYNYAEEINPPKDYRNISQEAVIARGRNIHSGQKYTKRKD